MSLLHLSCLKVKSKVFFLNRSFFSSVFLCSSLEVRSKSEGTLFALVRFWVGCVKKACAQMYGVLSNNSCWVETMREDVR